MAYSEDHIALAAEYALGTLDADERTQVETMMAVDTEFAALVQAWEFRLGPLNQMVGLVEPRPVVWENIKAAIGHAGAPQAPLVLPETPTATVTPPPITDDPGFGSAFDPEPAQPSEIPQPAEIRRPPIQPRYGVNDSTNMIALAGRVKRWRGIASAATAIAAALLVTLGLQIYRPDALPNAIRPKPRIQTVEVKTPAPALAPSAQYVALLQGQNGGPAFIMTIDGATKNFTVRKVGAPSEPGKSFELWLISDRLPQPRSLGVIGADDFTARPVLSGYDPDVINGATYAVTVEQAGGSPNGQPTSAPIFTGKLIETVPPASGSTR
ncbi:MULTISPECIES: anti-sigma factor domain-containing protein [unclassified Bradyrhizobium]|uniref:anti-sigma factor n=1 Tax=unclassified Bradyrhizobium TaxID=2631580 RepID=UPI001BA4D934|nr:MULTISPECIES: anti-sigma factor [unclassified Bradyrhizobium]MBR1208617.1 anti-sigma factor [Bradyrhizobium sp. AUGA SZCCT0124]MBR1314708.1 anti-sigma factor [Bradyrhizobium sp. AUGA SZCCT0051]MBR1345360.1 anti-sigma factor [Bradyrhizobium sp. AUGA SZCCT0105]MBR1359991.1 anti-sigma factor [Bradyrhizobium sp. AUGA SZCCT0045]